MLPCKKSVTKIWLHSALFGGTDNWNVVWVRILRISYFSLTLECWAEKWATIWNESILADVMELQSPAPIKRDCIAFLHSLWKPGHLLASVEIKWNYCHTTLLCDLLIQPSSRYVLVESNFSWLSLAASIRLVEKNWQQLVYQNENWKREKNWTVCTRIFGWIWLTWSGSVLKFSFQLRPAVCQNLIDIFHVLRNIQFNSDIKRPQCHWTLILISINMIVIGEDAAAFITLYSGHVTRLRHPRHLQPGVPPAHTSRPRNTRVITELPGSGSCMYIKQACYVYFDAT